MNRTIAFAALIATTAALPLEAQAQGQNRTPSRAAAETRGQVQGRGPVDIPPGQWPSAGRCRIWIDGIAPGQQPRETDCATARRTVPPNGRVIEGRVPSGTRAGRDGRSDRNGRNDRDDDDRDYDDDDDDDDDRYDRDDDRRGTRRFINRDGLECTEKAVTKNGKRSYDLKCREPKRGKNRQGDSWPPVRAQGDDRYCTDVNRDGRCDAGTSRGYPTTLPDMIGAIVFGQGQRTSDVAQWLGAGRYQVRYTDVNRDRRPERVRWLDGAGVLLQEWMDNDRDGRADVVNVYSGGRRVQSIGGR